LTVAQAKNLEGLIYHEDKLKMKGLQSPEGDGGPGFHFPHFNIQRLNEEMQRDSSPEVRGDGSPDSAPVYFRVSIPSLRSGI